MHHRRNILCSDTLRISWNRKDSLERPRRSLKDTWRTLGRSWLWR